MPNYAIDANPLGLKFVKYDIINKYIKHTEEEIETRLDGYKK
jgi:hypothetical protein